MAITTKGTKLYINVKKEGATTSTVEVEIKSFPDMGAAPNYIECTTLSDEYQKFVEGVKPMAAMEFTANYDAGKFAEITAITDVADYELAFGNGDKFTWKGRHKAIVVGGGVNAVVDMKISVMPEEEIAFAKAEVTA